MVTFSVLFVDFNIKYFSVALEQQMEELRVAAQNDERENTRGYRKELV